MYSVDGKMNYFLCRFKRKTSQNWSKYLCITTCISCFFSHKNDEFLEVIYLKSQRFHNNFDSCYGQKYKSTRFKILNKLCSTWLTFLRFFELVDIDVVSFGMCFNQIVTSLVYLISLSCQSWRHNTNFVTVVWNYKWLVQCNPKLYLKQNTKHS